MGVIFVVLKFDVFIDYFYSCVEHSIPFKDELLILGDFNIYSDRVEGNSVKFVGLQQHAK